MTHAPHDPSTDPQMRRMIRGSAGLGLVGAILGMVVGALLGAVFRYGTLYVGCHFIGLEGLIAGACVGLAASWLGRGSYLWLRIVSGVLAIAAVVGAVLIWMPWGTGKPYSVLFSNQPFNNLQTERDASIATLTNLLQLISYLVAGGVGFYFAGRRPMLRSGPVPRCMQCSADLRSSIAARHNHCPNCGAPIPENYR